MQALPSIRVADVPAGGLVQSAIEGRDRARALRDECVAWLPRRSSSTLPLLDKATRNWLRRSQSPYVGEIDAIAESLDHVGVWFLNGCYQWGCTSLAREQDGAPWLARTLDWPFPGLGRRLEIWRMQGAAGRFDNATWPGYVGTLTASAPGRFAASINQAPLRRRTRRPVLRPLDMLLNALRTWRIRHIPPDHLLRLVFETAKTYGEAKHLLETTPVARPVIYTLVGCEPGERCVIERTEDSFQTRNEDTSAANNWLRHAAVGGAGAGREPDHAHLRGGAANSRKRRETLAGWSGQFARGHFEWVTPPILNQQTRLAVELCPALGRLRAVGFEAIPGAELPNAVTLTCDLQEAA